MQESLLTWKTIWTMAAALAAFIVSIRVGLKHARYYGRFTRAERPREFGYYSVIIVVGGSVSLLVFLIFVAGLVQSTSVK